MTSSRAAKREPFYDVLRGFAIIGVVLTNSAAINQPMEKFDSPTGGFGPAPTFLDLLANHLNYLLFTDKSYPVFCFLFGVTTAFLVESSWRKNKSPSLNVFKRSFVLMLLGGLHIFAAWHGDILIIYALLSLMLLPFLFMNKVWSLRCLIGLTLLFCLSVFVRVLFVRETLENIAAISINFASPDFLYLAKAKFIKYYQWYWEPVLQGNLYSINYYFKFYVIMAWGFAFKHFNWLEQLKNNGGISFILGCVAIALGTVFYAYDWLEYAFASQFYYLTTLLIPVGYVLLFSLLSTDRLALRLLRPLILLGQNTMSIYLLSSVYFSLIYYGYGLGLYGALQSAEIMALGLVYLVVVYIWLQLLSLRGKRGPFERLYRAMMAFPYNLKPLTPGY